MEHNKKIETQEQPKPAPTEKEAKDEKDKKIEELTDLTKRVQADFENYKKRADKEQQNQVKLGKVLILKRLLPVLDTFDQALTHNPEDKGLRLVHQQLMAALAAEGLKEMKAEGKLDPYKHECLCEECSPHEKGTIVDEVRKGYMLDDLIIRHSLVKVSNGKTEQKEGQNDNLKKDA